MSWLRRLTEQETQEEQTTTSECSTGGFGQLEVDTSDNECNTERVLELEKELSFEDGQDLSEEGNSVRGLFAETFVPRKVSRERKTSGDTQMVTI
jgi:hypothetical protein